MKLETLLKPKQDITPTPAINTGEEMKSTELLSLKTFKLTTQTGFILCVPGSTFTPENSKIYIEKGLARPVNDSDFRHEFKKVSLYLQANEFSETGMKKLQQLVFELDEAWEAHSLFEFRSIKNLILDVPAMLPDKLEQKGGEQDMAWKKFTAKNYPETWDFKDCPTIEGFIIEHKTVQVNGEERSCCLIDVDGEVRTVWVSAGLSDLKTIPISETVRVTFDGQRINEKTRRTYNHFTIETFCEEDADVSFDTTPFDEKKPKEKVRA